MWYEVDLCSEHGDELTSLVEKVLPSAKKMGATTLPTETFAPPRKTAVKTSHKRVKPATATVREWAKSQGIEVNDKGRVPDALILQFQAAMED